jgi:ribosome maturation factor RimP
VFVDTDDGATIQDCARVTPEISATLDVADPVHESYELRVSTPGVDRPLMKADHFVECVGEEIQLVLMSPLGGRRKFTGVNQGLNGENVVIECSDGQHDVPLAYVQKACIKYKMDFGKKRP